MKAEIPRAVAQRLSLYLRQLEAKVARGESTVSSKVLAESIGASAAQVRRDLTYFGQFGRSGVGYPIEQLIKELRRIMGTDRVRRVALVGVGNVGTALLHYKGFREKGFEIVSMFDTDPGKIGQSVAGLVIQAMGSLSKIIRTKEIEMAILAVPVEAAQDVTDLLIESGIQGILNFAPTPLQVPDSVSLNNVDMAIELEQLSFQMKGSGTAETLA